jgi:protein AATF/BFR2
MSKLGMNFLSNLYLVGAEAVCSKSKLRKQEEVALGPLYAGARVSRKALRDADESPSSEYEDARESQDGVEFADPEADDMDVDDEDGDIDSDEAFGESDAEKFKGFSFRGSRSRESGTVIKSNNAIRRRKTAADFISASEDEESDFGSDIDSGIQAQDDSDMLEQFEDDDESIQSTDDDVSIQGNGNLNGTGDIGSGSDPEDDESDASESNDEEVDEDMKAGREEIRRIMNEEQRTVVAALSQAAKADAEKGNAVKQQRKTFDSLLNVRIRLQKALVASNSMSVADEKDDNALLPYQAAEEAAIKLLNTLDEMRQELEKAGNSKNGTRKRKRTINLDTSSSAIWQDMQNVDLTAMRTRQATLQKWSARVRDSTAQPIVRKLNNSVSQPTIIDILQDHLSNSERLVKRTKIPRSCAPVQAKMKVAEDPSIYDDADFYQLLLKELVDQRMLDSSNTTAPPGEGSRAIAQWTAVREAKTKKNVDTKASKGRKLRYTVHEKLQNFMAPEDRGTWEQNAIDRFFGTLLGQKVSLGEEDEEMSDKDEEGAPLEEEALMLFRS